MNKWANDFNDLGGLDNYTLNNVNFPAYSAYQVFLIDYDNLDSSLAKSYVPLEGEGLLQSKTVTEKGGIQEYVISGGGNYMEKLMLGATVGILNERYTRSTQYKEEDISGNNDNNFKYLKFGESLVTEGTGINLKVGMIYKFNKNFRLGFALHSPTRINFTDQSRVDMESHTENLNASPVSYYNQDTAQAFNYAISTPYKAIASGTFLFSRFGFLTADIEYVDYASMKYDMGIGYEDLSADLDAAIERVYRATSNIRIGAEAKVEDISLRFGFAYYGSPYKNTTWDASTRNITGGIGYRAKAWFLDLGFVQSKRNQIENAYFLYNGTSPRAVITRNTANLVITMGWKL